jgi:hypothetical protein
MEMLLKYHDDWEKCSKDSRMELNKRTTIIFGRLPVRDLNKLVLNRPFVKEFAMKYGLLTGYNVSTMEEKQDVKKAMDEVAEKMINDGYPL